MSIESKHAYRFRFLKSEKWQQIRLDTLVRFEGKCHICGKEKYDNDVHHVVYPDDWNESGDKHLITLCRTCHDFIHGYMDHRKIIKKSHRWKIIKEFRKYFGICNPNGLPKIVTKIKKCHGCLTTENIEKRNVFCLTKHWEWGVMLCCSCHDKVARYVSEIEKNGGLEKEQDWFIFSKRFLTALRSSIDNSTPLI